MPPGWTAASAISGLPITSVAVRSGSLTILARSMATTIEPPVTAAATVSAALAGRGPGNAQAKTADMTMKKRPGPKPRRQANAIILAPHAYKPAATHTAAQHPTLAIKLNAKW